MSSAVPLGRLIVLLLAFACVSPLASAHEQKVALTDIFYNERTGNLEVAHRISLHDAEHTLRKVTDSKADLVRSKGARAAFANYVASHFELSFKDKNALKLAMVGQEIEGGYLWVYQETKIPNPVNAAFFIENTILQGVVKGQVNTVNVRYRNQVATFEFAEEAGRQLYAGPAEGEEKKKKAVAGER